MFIHIFESKCFDIFGNRQIGHHFLKQVQSISITYSIDGVSKILIKYSQISHKKWIKFHSNPVSASSFMFIWACSSTLPFYALTIIAEPTLKSRWKCNVIVKCGGKWDSHYYYQQSQEPNFWTKKYWGTIFIGSQFTVDPKLKKSERFIFTSFIPLMRMKWRKKKHIFKSQWVNDLQIPNVIHFLACETNTRHSVKFKFYFFGIRFECARIRDFEVKIISLTSTPQRYSV